MRVRMGNPRLHEQVNGELVRVGQVGDDPVVYEHPIYLGEGGESITVGADVRDLALHLAQNTGMVTRLPGHSAFVKVVRDWPQHCAEPPLWVQTDWSTPDEDVDAVEDFERQLAEFYGCPRGAPEDVEETHWTEDASPPGVDSGKFRTSEEG